MSYWKAATGRITLFPAVQPSPNSLSAIDLYKLAWHGDPDNFQKQSNPLAPSVAQGTRDGIQVACVTHPLRIDFNVSPPPPGQETAQASIPLFKNINQLYTELNGIIKVIATGSLPLSVARVALYLQFLVLSDNAENANIALAEVIPDQYGVRVSDEEDVVFQINRPYKSTEAANIKVNRLTRWSIDRIQVLLLTVTTTPGGQLSGSERAPHAVPTTHDFIAADVMFDINSLAAERPLSAKEQSALLAEALRMARQMQEEFGLKF